MTKHQEIETRTQKIRELTAQAHAHTNHPVRTEFSKIIADINGEIHILLREIEEIASTMG